MEIRISTTVSSKPLVARSGRKAGLISRLRNKTQRKSVRRRIMRASFAITNVAVLAVVLLVVLHARTTGASDVIMHSATASQPATNPLDQVSSADIAVTVSRMSGLAESTAIKNQSESDDIQLASAPTTNNVVSKPQIPATTFKSNKDIQSYVVQSGESVSSIAAKFSVTSDSIRWSNGLTGDNVAAGTRLVIPPVGLSGIVYTVKAGDTLDSLAQKYQADKSQLIAANDAEITGITVGEQIIIPNGQQPVVTYASSYSNASAFPWGGSAIYGYNGYDYGYCTWWVANRRAQVGMPLPSNLGNASSWPAIGRLAGLAEGNTPKQYAAAVTSTRGEGHVVFVEAVNDDGSIVISEMNHLGWAVKDTETISAAQAASYIYIY